MNLNLFIQFPNGDTIRKDTITGVRLGDAQAKTGIHGFQLFPRVIVDFVTGDHGNCIVLDCKSDAERDSLAEAINAQLGAVIPVVAETEPESMRKLIRRIYIALFRPYVVMDTQLVDYSEADRMIREEGYELAKQEDENLDLNKAWVQKRYYIPE